MNFHSIENLFDSFKDLNVLIIGDVMVDSYIYGSVSRISPEAPVPIINVKSRDQRLGGAANVALNIQSLGANPILCSIIGDDLGADDFMALLKKRSMTREGIIRSAKRMTTVKNRVISGGHHLIRIDEEIDQPLDDIDRKSLMGHINRLIEKCDVVVFEDYDKGCLDEILIESTIQCAKKKGIPTAVDPKKRNFLNYRNATIFKPNLKELREGMKIDITNGNTEEVKSAVDLLHKKINFENALITLSEHGIYSSNSSDTYHYPAHLRSISDVSGAGDTVISIAAVCQAMNVPLAFLSELSNLGGGIVCEYPGVVPIDRERLLAEAKQNEILNAFFS